MNLYKINPECLRNENHVSVAIIDSGFTQIPKYAKIYRINNQSNHKHGNRVLSIFSSLDRDYPIPNLSLHLICYDPQSGYQGLIKAFKILPYVDILSISLSWKDNDLTIKNLMFEKAKKICAPFTLNKNDLLYPCIYEGIITCSQQNNINANYSINPVPEYSGNSYAVPAIARLLAYNAELKNDNENGVDVSELFNNYKNPFIQIAKLQKKNNLYFSSKCYFCKKTLRTKEHTLAHELPYKCPYCGNKLRG